MNMCLLIPLITLLFMAALFFVIYLFSLVVQALTPWYMALPQTTQEILAFLLLVVILAGANVIAYFASYKWSGVGSRKEWYFWLCLVVSIVFLLMMLGAMI